jgi:hypothetical protein
MVILPVTADLKAGDIEDSKSQRHRGADKQLLAKRKLEPGHCKTQVEDDDFGKASARA